MIYCSNTTFFQLNEIHHGHSTKMVPDHKNTTLVLLSSNKGQKALLPANTKYRVNYQINYCTELFSESDAYPHCIVILALDCLLFASTDTKALHSSSTRRSVSKYQHKGCDKQS